MSVVDDFKPYIDRYGLSCLDKGSDGYGVTTQNGALFTMQYLFCVKEFAPEFFDQEVNRLKPIFKALEKSPGLSRRFIHSTEIDSMDNQTALLTFSALFDDSRYAKDMYAYGLNTRCEELDLSEKPDETKKYYFLAKALSGFKAPNFVWNMPNPGKFNIRAWWGRSPSLIGLAKMTSGEKCNIFYKVAVFIGQFVGIFQPKDDCDARTLPFISWQFLRTRSFFWRFWYKVWSFILHIQYKGGIGQVYAQYYKDKAHPILRYYADDKTR